MSFTRKKLEFSIQLASNTQMNQPNQFSGTGSSLVTVKDARASVRIFDSGTPSPSLSEVEIYGLDQSLMDELSTLGMQINVVPKNTLTITAGDDENGLSSVFSGTIVNAYADYNGSPQVPFRMSCQTGLAEAVAPATASSFNGSTDVATIMAGFARLLSRGFENNGVSIQLNNPYFSGSVIQQMRSCAEHAGINAELIGNLLSIWPKYGSRNTPTIPLIAAAPTGTMIGYPSFTQQGIMVRDLFNPKISFGGKVEVKSDFPKKASGIYVVHKLDLALDCQMPRGQWMATVYGYSPNSPNPVLPP